MGWQDDIRKLDEDLAAGRIAAEEYRVRRDTILSSAAASGQQVAPPTHAESTQMMPPVGGQGGTQSGPQPGQNPERTQVVPGNSIGQQGWQSQPNYGQQGSWSQNIPGVPPQQGAPGMAGPRPAPGAGPMPGPAGPQAGSPQQGQLPPPQGGYPGGWDNQQGGDTAPPWSGSAFPPLSQQGGGQDWLKQGPDSFDTASSGKGRVWLIIGIVVVVIALGVGGYFLFVPGSHNTAGGGGGGTATATTAPPTSTTPAGPPDLRIAKLPGTGQVMGNINSFPDVITAQLLTPDENTIYEDAGATACQYATVTLPSGVSISVLTVAPAPPVPRTPRCRPWSASR